MYLDWIKKKMLVPRVIRALVFCIFRWFTYQPLLYMLFLCFLILHLFGFCFVDLAQNRYFEDEAFIEYLKYLQYWQRPEYIKFIM